MVERIKNFFAKKEDERLKKYHKIVNIINTLGIAVSFYIVGKYVSKMQFMNALFKADFITPPDKFGHSNITGIDSFDDIIGNTVKLHKKGEIINC